MLLWVDVETTGLDPSHGAILEIGMRWTDTRLDRLDGGFSTPVAYAGPVDGFIERMHGPNGLLAAWARPGAPTSDEAARLARARMWRPACRMGCASSRRARRSGSTGIGWTRGCRACCPACIIAAWT